MEAAGMLKRTTTQVRTEASAAGIRHFMYKGGLLYKREDVERLKERLGVADAAAAPAGGGVVEDIDLDELFAGQQGGSVDSGLFDNTGLSDSGLFESRHVPKRGKSPEPPRPPNKPGRPP
jgi:hypothetical protein